MKRWLQGTALAVAMCGILMISACLTPGERRGERDLERDVERKVEAAAKTEPGSPENEAAKAAVSEAQAKLEVYKAQMEVIRRERGVTVASGFEMAGGLAGSIPWAAAFGPALTLIGGGIRMFTQGGKA